MNFKIISLNLQWWLSVCDPELYRSWPELQSGAGTQRAAGWRRVEEGGGGGWRVQQLLLRSSRQTAAASLSLSLLGSLARSHSLSLLFSFTYAHTHMLQRQWTGRTPRKQIRSLSFKFASAATEEQNFVFFFFDKRTWKYLQSCHPDLHTCSIFKGRTVGCFYEPPTISCSSLLL